MLNVCTIMGRLTTAPELKQTEKGTFLTRFCIASQSSINKENTDFIDCVAWTKNAENICQYFNKGDRIIVSGPLQTRTFEANDGSKRKVCEIMVKQFEFVETKTSTGGNDQAGLPFDTNFV